MWNVCKMGDCVKTKRFLMQNFLLRHRFAVTFLPVSVSEPAMRI